MERRGRPSGDAGGVLQPVDRRSASEIRSLVETTRIDRRSARRAYHPSVTATRIILAPGASGNPDQLSVHRAGLERRGYHTTVIGLPRGRAERAVPAYRAAVDEPSAAVIGGQSFGGRVASLLAAQEPPAALVCFSYPLHAPGRQPSWVERTAHWPRVACPVLLLSGEADPFADIALLHRAVRLLPRANLVTYPGLGHSLLRVVDQALDEVDRFIRTNA